jgi:hypothetical protein
MKKQFESIFNRRENLRKYSNLLLFNYFHAIIFEYFMNHSFNEGERKDKAFNSK